MKGNEIRTLDSLLNNMELYHSTEVTVESKSLTNISHCLQTSIY